MKPFQLLQFQEYNLVSSSRSHLAHHISIFHHLKLHPKFSLGCQMCIVHVGNQIMKNKMALKPICPCCKNVTRNTPMCVLVDSRTFMIVSDWCLVMFHEFWWWSCLSLLCWVVGECPTPLPHATTHSLLQNTGVIALALHFTWVVVYFMLESLC